MEFAIEAVRHSPYWNTLGAARYRTGDYTGAIAALEQSMKLRMEDDGFEWFLLAMAQWQLGHKREAREWYDKAVAWVKEMKPKDGELTCVHAEAAELLGATIRNPVEQGPPPREKK